MKPLLLSAILLIPGSLPAQQSGGPARALEGISNRGQNQREPYVTAGDRAYAIGTQDGDFPDLGTHVPGEMGGVWVPPVKLLDGLWGAVGEGGAPEAPLAKAGEFINYPYGNRFRYGPVLDSLEIERFQFSPDGHPGVIVQYTFTNASARPRTLTFRLAARTDISPVWLSEKIGILDAPDIVAWEPAQSRYAARDTQHSWFAVWGAAASAGGQPIADPLPIKTAGMGTIAASRYTVSVTPHGSDALTFVVAGSAVSKKKAESTYAILLRNHPALLARKKAHYVALLDRGRITIPDQRLQRVYDWVRVGGEWLVRDVPGIGRGITAGFMEYPWWFGADAGYSLQASLAAGNADVARQTLRLLRSQSAKFNGNGRIIHEVTTYGALSNPGTTQETAQFILTVGETVAWTGDLAFAREMYPAMTQGLNWLLSDMDKDGNLFPGGYGITEILGLNAELIDVAVYTQQALLATAEVAGVLGKQADAARYRHLASELEQRINRHFWLEEEVSYADFYGTRNQAIGAAEGAIQQINLQGPDKLTARDRDLAGYYDRLKAKLAAMPDTTRGWITNKNWVVATPMEVGIAPRERAIRVLDRIRRNDVGKYGPYLSAVERQAMMTISTGVLAVAEAQYGRIDQSLWYAGKIVETFNRKLPGSISEMMPDYGCFVQAWTMYGIVVPLVRHVFGVQPDAVTKTVVFQPRLPSGWEDMSIEDLPVGANRVSFARAKTGKGIEYRIEGTESGWRYVLKAEQLPGTRYYLNGKPVTPDSVGILR
jgi:glycogen debranching enzyme